MKYTNDFHYEGKSSCATTKSTPFAVSQDEWDTKEDTDKSMKNALYQELIIFVWYKYYELLIVRTAVCQKAPLGLKQRQTVKKISRP